jgi:tetratricopeptide (TPR) repeat protein
MSDEVYETCPECRDDPAMKKIDEVLNWSDVDQALKACKEVLDKPDKPLKKIVKAHAYVHMGVLHYKKDDKTNALKMWDKALDLETYEPDARYNKEKITAGKPKKE